MQIHQLLAGFSLYDAISNEAIYLQKILQKWQYPSYIYADLKHTHPSLKNKALSYFELTPQKDDLVIYHFSIGSDISNFFSRLNCKKILRYHNITPHTYLKNIDEQKMSVLEKGRQELLKLKDTPDLSLADSEYNRQELREQNFHNVQVLPIAINTKLLQTSPNRGLIKTYNDTYINFLFVGRLVPNKKFEDLIKVFYFYHKTINPNSRLFIVGSYTGLENYFSYLKIIIDKLNLNNVVFSGSIKQKDLVAYYQVADVFLCMSEHEGFCVPLLEAMYFDVPIIALAKTAVPYTLGESGVLIHKKKYKYIAELTDILLKNKKLKKQIIQQQQNRLSDFSNDKLEKKLKNYLEKFTG